MKKALIADTAGVSLVAGSTMAVRHDATVKYYYLDTKGEQAGPVLLASLKELTGLLEQHTEALVQVSCHERSREEHK